MGSIKIHILGLLIAILSLFSTIVFHPLTVQKWLFHFISLYHCYQWHRNGSIKHTGSRTYIVILFSSSLLSSLHTCSISNSQQPCLKPSSTFSDISRCRPPLLASTSCPTEKRRVLWDRLFRLFSDALLYQACAPFSLFTIFPQTISLLCTWVCLFVCFFSSHMCYYLCPINNSSFTTYFLHQIILFSPGLCN